ncbi:Heparan-alpha-glucosaminide N-acetyltransferase [Vitis vinifera]|uniref:Heparan-alpha-glucosaminide N-acetyltransferase n=1 Tax=Vitis vinifera TaxID=29760 RepID=A0A438D828_VITVI|nr:Heparan-alpha-glucosaminide N-acetyltransferase [Vitis vinifera]
MQDSKMESENQMLLYCSNLALLCYEGSFTQDPDKLTYGVDMKKIRWCGILQRIALAYLVVALLEITTKKAQAKDLSPGQFSIFKLYCWHWLMGACVLIVYMAVSYGTYVPDWHFTVHDRDSADYGKVLTVACGARGKLDPPCNVVGYIDREILGMNHMYQHPAWRRSKACTEYSPDKGPFRKDAPSWCYAPFEPEGILSSISAILSTIIGVHFGHVLLHLKGHSDRLKHWVVTGFALLILGITLHFTGAIPLNKQLYTFSYVCVTSGAAALVFSFFYILVCYSSERNWEPVLMWHSVCGDCKNSPKKGKQLQSNCNSPRAIKLWATSPTYMSRMITNMLVVDVWGMRFLCLPLEWIGMNAMLVYVMAAEGVFAKFINGWYYGDPHNTLVHFLSAYKLDSTTHLHPSLAFKKSGHPTLCHLRGNPLLGYSCRHFAPAGPSLEALGA